MTENRYNIPMLKKSFELLEELGQHPEGQSMQELITALGQAKTSVYRLLLSLMQLGYVCKDEVGCRYYLSRKLLRLGLAALGNANIVERALPHMRRLRDGICESVMLGVLMNDQVVLLEQVLGSHDFTFMLRPGARFALHASAPGKLFLAFSSEEEQKRLLESMDYIIYNKRTIRNEAEMQDEILRVRQCGYATDLEEGLDGVHCVAAPVLDQSGDITAVLWTSGPSGRMKKEMFPAIADELKKAAEQISTSCS